jgi:uncharacterized Zn finger protein (UPF0148 family)
MDNRECCGRPCQTPFCPHCGREVTSDPLRELLNHVRKQARSRRKMAQERAEWLARTDLTEKQRTRAERRARATEAAAAKWQQWHDALAELLSRQNRVKE